MNTQSFYAGICVSLQYVALHDNATMWAEIVVGTGDVKSLFEHAKKNDQLELAGFNQYSNLECLTGLK